MSREDGRRDRQRIPLVTHSGAVEAIAGDRTAEHLADAMGNTLWASNALYETYLPPNVASLPKVIEARRRGRAELRTENEPGRKAGTGRAEKLKRSDTG